MACAAWHYQSGVLRRKIFQAPEKQDKPFCFTPALPTLCVMLMQISIHSEALSQDTERTSNFPNDRAFDCFYQCGNRSMMDSSLRWNDMVGGVVVGEKQRFSLLDIGLHLPPVSC
ncbi:MAG: hypothetical protein JKY10_11595 [Cohaesibacteraceae bacterium]|nr:hypothetical protein [Cohaesibacteraceae bacterium]